MVRFYSDENFPFAAVRVLRDLGYDVLTTKDAGRDNQGIPDDQVLEIATSLDRCVLTLNRRDFMHLHNAGLVHTGIVICKARRTMISGDWRNVSTAPWDPWMISGAGLSE